MSRVRTQSATRWTTAHRLLALAGVRDARVHDGRHTAATVLIELGVHVRIVQEILSHSDIRLTQRYTHVASPIAVDAAQQMGGALGQYAVRVTELQPGWLPGSRSNRVCAGQRVFLVEPPVGIEPTTFSLRVGPTAYDWASTSAFAYCSPSSMPGISHHGRHHASRPAGCPPPTDCRPLSSVQRSAADDG
jgi:Phage integrase family